MIPRKLALTNFMCYRHETLDFAGIHVACLSGDNGAGKSALLDAMTWAMWGKARTRRDDELIRLGQDEMEVDFTFELGEELYRVIRKRRAGKRGQSLLDLQLRDEGRWRSLGESSIRATQAKIDNVLRLDYDTFVNSAFLRQGRADEFTVKTPAERKRVLGEILGLDVWQEYEEQAKQQLRTLESEARALEMRLEEIEAELARRSEYEQEVQAAQAEIVDLSAELQKVQAAWQVLEAARAELRLVRSQLGELARRLQQAEKELSVLQREQEEHQGDLERYRALMAQAGEIEAGFAAYQEAMEQERKLGEKLTALTGLNEQRNELQAQLSEARHALQTRRELAARSVEQLEARLPSPELLQSYQELRAQVDHLTQLQESREAARIDMARLAEERAGLHAHNQALRPEMDVLKERIELLEQAEANCPLCSQPLGEEDRQRLTTELQDEGKQRGDSYRANKLRLEEISLEVANLETQIARAEVLLRDLPDLRRELTRLEEQVRAGTEAQEPLREARVEVTRLEAELAGETYAPQVRQQLEDVLAQAVELGYDRTSHEAARQAVVEGQPFAERMAQLKAARTGVAQEEAALTRVEAAIGRWQEQLAADRLRRGELETEAERLEEQLQEAAAVEEQLNHRRAAEAEARQRLGAARQRLAACDAMKRQKKRRQERRDELARLQAIYDELRTAFSVRGVPAMIIEAAVPEIEAEANRLLGRMTAGRMHVRMETQRETLAGDLRETLDIHIMDELGERPYDNFSGGEQFRINFALRIALSRLLARRAGAELQTLIIDEGFGTQDAQGRERLVEAIHAIQEEFARVLVITHIEELQDAFPVRIQVTKMPSGSTIELM